MAGEVKIIKPADPAKVKAWYESLSDRDKKRIDQQRTGKKYVYNTEIPMGQSRYGRIVKD